MSIAEKNIQAIGLKPRVLVLYGVGLNCDYETQHAFELAGADAERVHINTLAEREDDLNNYEIAALVGGFSYGDYLGEGRVLAVKFRNTPALSDQLYRFIESGKQMIGICNGYQIMTELGVLPGIDGDYKTRRVALAPNDCGRFIDDWVYLDFDPESPCVCTKGIERVELPHMPIRHGAGRLVIDNADGGYARRVLQDKHLMPVFYSDNLGRRTPEANPNGSEFNSAGLCDETGKLLGLMPHPEAFLYAVNGPYYSMKKSLARATENKIPDEGPGRLIFEKAVKHAKEG